MKRMLLIFFVCYWANLKAQTLIFQKLFNDSINRGASPKNLILTGDNGFLILADSHDTITSLNANLIKLDSSGTLEWSGTIDLENFQNRANAAAYTSDHGYVFVGYSNYYSPLTNNHTSICKIDSLGNVQWSKIMLGYGLSVGTAVWNTADDRIAVLSIIGAGSHQVQIIMLDNSGNKIWSKAYGTAIAGDNFVYNIIKTSDGGLAFGGIAQRYVNLSGFLSYYIVKLDSIGNVMWTMAYPMDNGFTNSSNKLVQTVDKGFALIGSSKSTLNANLNFSYDFFVLKTDSLGNSLWANGYGTMNTDHSYDGIATSDGNILLSGYYSSNSSSVYPKAMSIKLNLTGAVEWCKSYDTLSYIDHEFVIQTNDNGYLIAANKLAKIFLIKTDSSGESSCNSFSITPIITSYIINDSAVNTLTYSGLDSIIDINYYKYNYFIDSTLCTATGINIIEKEKPGIQLTPNPFISEISITIQSPNAKQAIFIIKNILGQKIFSSQQNNLSNIYTKTIDLSFISKGIYLLDIFIDGERTVKKIVKE